MLVKQRYEHRVETVTQRLGSIDYTVNIHEFIKGSKLGLDQRLKVDLGRFAESL